ncbi:MAG: RNA-splicing ligase RtcB [candidate division Zixibacteria bacterium HGW-Zixibacteria-1]|nr:MAG: RNA-splicing ligase RtcB [candidate division Zixibacteria bacterium HGW-Zixibacteria-1]
MTREKYRRIGDNIWEIPVDYKAGMRVPARILSSSQLIDGIDEKVIDQITNVACLPGIKRYALCMPDGHMGYGFPIGGVAAFSLSDGVISPGGIGFDINCGMRMLRTNLTLDELRPKMEELLNGLFRTIPSGVGSKGFLNLDRRNFNAVMEQGLDWCLENEYATETDIERIEDRGHLRGGDHGKVSEKAVSRGINQMGTLGSGNHYLEVEIARPENIYNRDIAGQFGIDRDNQVLVAIHCGSRGFGHQIATDYLQVFAGSVRKYGLEVRDRELMSAPIDSDEGRNYASAMACAANAAFVNRQLIVYGIRKVFRQVFGKNDTELGIETIYDVAHNIAKFEKYFIDGREETLLVHRKGATRSFGPGKAEVPEVYRRVGQPVIVGGSMETGSALLCGTAVADSETFGSSLHGAGRTMSRMKAKKTIRGDMVKKRMHDSGILVKTGYMPGLAEEAAFAYKDIDQVVDAVDKLGISRKVARFDPVLNIKG